MKSITSAILVALLTAACSGGTVSTAPSTEQSSIASPSAAEPTATASAPAADALTGQWTTGSTSCAQQNTAVEAAGFTAEQMTLGGWSPTCTDGMPHGSRFTTFFAAGKMLIFQDGFESWTGLYRILDDQTFEAGDADNGYYITYKFAIDGDQLTIDITNNDCPFCKTAADLAGEQIAQTVIFETSPFTRQD